MTSASQVDLSAVDAFAVGDEWRARSGASLASSTARSQRVDRVVGLADDGGDSMLYATRVDAAQLVFGDIGRVLASAKSQFVAAASTRSIVLLALARRGDEMLADVDSRCGGSVAGAGVESVDETNERAQRRAECARAGGNGDVDAASRRRRPHRQHGAVVAHVAGNKLLLARSTFPTSRCRRADRIAARRGRWRHDDDDDGVDDFDDDDARHAKVGLVAATIDEQRAADRRRCRTSEDIRKLTR